MRDYGDERQRIGDDDCSSLQQLPRMTMVADDDGVEQQQHARAGGGRRRARDKTGWQTKTIFGKY